MSDIIIYYLILTGVGFMLSGALYLFIEYLKIRRQIKNLEK